MGEVLSHSSPFKVFKPLLGLRTLLSVQPSTVCGGSHSAHEWVKFRDFLFNQGIMQHGEQLEDQDLEGVYPEFIESWRCDSDEYKHFETSHKVR